MFTATNTLSISVLLAESIPTHTWCLFSAHFAKGQSAKLARFMDTATATATGTGSGGHEHRSEEEARLIVSVLHCICMH